MPGQNPEFSQNLRPISLLSTNGKLFEKAILRIVQRHSEENNILNLCQFCFHACHSMTLQCMRLMDHMTLNCNNNISAAAVFLDIKKAFNTTWQPGLLYKLSELHFLFRSIKLISSFQQKIQSYDCRQTVHALIYKQGCHKVPSCPVPCTACT
jgi:hypothetical protein